jgi:hypothetical protein
LVLVETGRIIINDLVQRSIHGFTQPLLVEFRLWSNLSML